MEVFPGISMDPDVRFGKPCIAGTRIDVATVVGALGAGETMETVSQEYALTLEQVRTALSYAAHVAAHFPPAVRRASRRSCSTMSERIAIWRKAVNELVQTTPADRLFELGDDGELRPWRDIPLSG